MSYLKDPVLIAVCLALLAVGGMFHMGPQNSDLLVQFGSSMFAVIMLTFVISEVWIRRSSATVATFLTPSFGKGLLLLAIVAPITVRLGLLGCKILGRARQEKPQEISLSAERLPKRRYGARKVRRRVAVDTNGYEFASGGDGGLLRQAIVAREVPALDYSPDTQDSSYALSGCSYANLESDIDCSFKYPPQGYSPPPPPAPPPPLPPPPILRNRRERTRYILVPSYQYQDAENEHELVERFHEKLFPPSPTPAPDRKVVTFQQPVHSEADAEILPSQEEAVSGEHNTGDVGDGEMEIRLSQMPSKGAVEMQTSEDSKKSAVVVDVQMNPSQDVNPSQAKGPCKSRFKAICGRSSGHNYDYSHFKKSACRHESLRRHREEIKPHLATLRAKIGKEERASEEASLSSRESSHACLPVLMGMAGGRRNSMANHFFKSVLGSRALLPGSGWGILLLVLDFFVVFNLIAAFFHWFAYRETNPILMGFALAATLFLFYHVAQERRRRKKLKEGVTAWPATTEKTSKEEDKVEDEQTGNAWNVPFSFEARPI